MLEMLSLPVACVDVGSSSPRAEALPQPVIPFHTSFRHWDHHLFLWTPTHPLYESIEAAASTSPGGRELVWVWFTERAVPKKQVHYVSDPETARGEHVQVRSIDY